MKHSSTSQAARKYHYWRGVRATLLILAPFIVALMYACTEALRILMPA